MKKMLLICGAMLALTATAALAQVTAPGLYLNWNGCAGDGATQLKTFACTSTNGSETIVATWVPAVDVPLFNGLELFVDFAVDGGVLPAWWGTACSGRANPVQVGLTYPAAGINCADIYAGAGGGGLAAYNQNWNGGGTTQVDIFGAVPAGSEQQLATGQEYFCSNILISNAKSTVASGCVGCLVPACINFQELRYDQPAPTVEQVVKHVGVIGTRNAAFVYWQSTNVVNCIPGASASKNSTWGSVKALYR